MTHYRSIRQTINMVDANGRILEIIVTNNNGHYEVNVRVVAVVKR